MFPERPDLWPPLPHCDHCLDLSAAVPMCERAFVSLCEGTHLGEGFDSHVHAPVSVSTLCSDVPVPAHPSAYLHAWLGELMCMTVPECLSSGLCVQLQCDSVCAGIRASLQVFQHTYMVWDVCSLGL